MTKFMIAFEGAVSGQASVEYKKSDEIVGFLKKKYPACYVSRRYNGSGFVVVNTDQDYKVVVNELGFNTEKPKFLGFVCPVPERLSGYYDQDFWTFLKK